MRKAQKAQAEEFAALLEQAHDEIKEAVDMGKNNIAADLLTQCQEGAIRLGELIEKTEGEGFSTISLLERYCELVYQAHEELSGGAAVNANNVYKKLRKALIQIQNSIRNDIKVRLEMVFLPYKASMWDSLESVWMAADADPDCDAYVVPIPYYDKNNDGSLGTYHYEGNELPEDVPVVHYDAYDFAQRKPDVIYIHNPYDNNNFVTTVEPRFYSAELKKYTDLLVYIPYYSTTGGMSEGQVSCPAYYNADYIVIQAEKYRRFFDSQIPADKFLVMGSPKFDRVIRMCANPPAAPEDWKKKMEGKKVYFYNTSIGEMLGNTEQFLKKMRYVFDCFQGREDACLLWRPHPLLEATFDSMRPQYRPQYEELKRRFIEEQIGIYDTTPDIERVIALSDVYIGGGGSSVVSLFGVAGKPIFLLNSYYDEKPVEDDWKGTIFVTARGDRQNKYCVLQRNKLYYSPNDDFQYEYYCDLPAGATESYFQTGIEYEGRVYIAPVNAQYFWVVEKNRTIRKIDLRHEDGQGNAFLGMWFWKNKIYLLPDMYSSLVILDLPTESITYISGIRDFNVGLVNGERVSAAKWIWRDKLYFLNPTGNRLLIINEEDSCKATIKQVPFGRLLTRCAAKKQDDETLWLIPYSGTIVTRWKPETDEIKDYDVRLEGMISVHRGDKKECNIHMLGSVTFYDEKMIISPEWGNKFVELNTNTGDVKEWIPPFETSTQDKNKYYPNWGMGYFCRDMYDNSYQYFYAPERKIYDIDFNTKTAKEVKVSFRKEEIFENVQGFSKWSEEMQYAGREDVFNSLEDLLNDSLHGNQFDKEEQVRLYATINASVNGDCGEKVYRFVSGK